MSTTARAPWVFARALGTPSLLTERRAERRDRCSIGIGTHSIPYARAHTYEVRTHLPTRAHTHIYTHAHVALAATRRDVVRPAAAKGRADLPSQPPTPSPPRRPFAAG